MISKRATWADVKKTVGNNRLSIIMPIYNLASQVLSNIRKTAELFAANGINAEIIPVDDGSLDGTGSLLAKVSTEKFDCVTIKPVICPINGGKGAALRSGFDASTGELVMLLDGDLDILPEQTPWFFEAMITKNADVVVGSKRHKYSQVQYPWHRRIVSWVYFTIVRLFIGLPITDTQTGMKLFKRKVLGEALSRMLVKTYAFDLELLAIAHQRGAKIAEAPVIIRFGSKFGALSPNTVKVMALDSLAVFYRLKILKYYAKAEVPPKLEVPPFISVVIACPQGSEVLDECIRALEAQVYRNFEVIVLPDGELDLGKRMIDLKIIPTGKVRPAEKRNLGIKESKGSIVAFIDDDAYPDVHWLEYAIRYFGDDTIGAVGGPGVTPPNDPYLARVGGRAYDNILLSGNYRYRYKAGGVKRDVDDYPSCNLLVRTDILRKINGYRTDFWPGEDTLLCKDIIDSGYRIVYDPWVVVNHHRRSLFGPHLRQLGRYAFHRGYFVKRYPSNSLRLSYFIPSAFVIYLLLWPLVLSLTITPESILWYLQAAFLIPIGFYFALLLLTSFSFNILTWLLTAAGVFASHVWYGIRFLQGLFAAKAPCEFIGKDHV
jgi:glycosyltransferase involved in cell wall biosynthesis